MKLNKIKKYIFGATILGILGFVVFFSAYLFSISYGQNHIYDYMTALTAEKKLSDDVIVVAIDDQSINKIGRWPWSRTLYADIFEFLENHGNVSAIAFDSILVSYGDEKEDKEFFERIDKLNKVIPGVFFSKKKTYFSNDNENLIYDLFKDKFSLKLQDKRNKILIDNSEYKSSSYAIEEVLNAVSGIGSVLSAPDSDGVIRKFEPVFKFKDRYYPSLALSVLMKKNNIKAFRLDEQSLKVFKSTKTDPEFLIPLLSDLTSSYAYINWYLPVDGYSYPFKTYSAWKIIKSYEQIKKGETPLINPEELKGKVVVVGGTSTGLRDIKSSPIKLDYPGVYIQATAIDNMLNNKFILKISDKVNNYINVFSIIASLLAIFYFPPIFSSVLLVFFAVGYFYICLFIAFPNNIAPDALTPIIFIGCSMLLGYGYKYFIEDSKKRKIRNLIAKYVSKDIMEAILEDIDNAKLGGKRAEVSILFADIRNFTTISETLEPEKVSEILNEYFNEMVPIIFKYNGTVNKFVGDALLVIFGAPLSYENHAELAVKCAAEMNNKINTLREKWIKESKPEINIGIGISTGEAFVGNIGSDERFEYSAVGNTVNIASRLESFNKLYKTSILISEHTYKTVKDIIEVEEIDSVCVTQSSDPMKIFELKKIKETFTDKNGSTANR